MHFPKWGSFDKKALQNIINVFASHNFKTVQTWMNNDISLWKTRRKQGRHVILIKWFGVTGRKRKKATCPDKDFSSSKTQTFPNWNFYQSYPHRNMSEKNKATLLINRKTNQVMKWAIEQLLLWRWACNMILDNHLDWYLFQNIMIVFLASQGALEVMGVTESLSE